MGSRSRTTSTKRQREAAKREKKQRKEERKAQRAAEKAQRAAGLGTAELDLTEVSAPGEPEP